MPGELAAEERSDEPRVPSVRSNGPAAARDAGSIPDAPRVEPAHCNSTNVAQRVPVIRRPLALRHPVPRRLVRIDHEGQEDVRVLSGHELVKRVRDDIFRAAAREDELPDAALRELRGIFRTRLALHRADGAYFGNSGALALLVCSLRAALS